MNWWKIASSKKNLLATQNDSLEDRIKHKVRSSPFFAVLFSKFNVDPDAFNDVHIITKPLDGVFCEANGDEIVIDDKLAKQDILGEQFHFVAHEIHHWLQRKASEQSYFSDPEEVESFNTAIAFAMNEWKNQSNIGKLIVKHFLPLVKTSIEDDQKAMSFLKDRYKAAKALLADMNLCNYSS